jgi:hypothetical protein
MPESGNVFRSIGVSSAQTDHTNYSCHRSSQVRKHFPETHIRANDSVLVHQNGSSPVLAAIAVLPFYELSRSRVDLHGVQLNNTLKKDYVHFCYTPLFYEPLVDSMVRAVVASRGKRIPPATPS